MVPRDFDNDLHQLDIILSFNYGYLLTMVNYGYLDITMVIYISLCVPE